MSPPEHPRDRVAGERGTSTMEVAGIAPLVIAIILLLVYAAFALYGVTATQTAARQAARAASLGDDPAAAADAAMPGWLTHRVETEAAGSGEGTLVRVTADLPDVVPGTDLQVSRQAVMP